MHAFTQREVQVKPKLLESRIASNKEFTQLGEGFKKIFSKDNDDQEKLKLPIAGYMGHRKGERSENLYG